MDEWSEGGLGQQRDDGGGRAIMRYEGVESLGAYVDNLVLTLPFSLGIIFLVHTEVNILIAFVINPGRRIPHRCLNHSSPEYQEQVSRHVINVLVLIGGHKH